jgi:hypothetical protein
VKVGDLARVVNTDGLGLIVDFGIEQISIYLQVYLYYPFYHPPQVINFDIQDVKVVYAI